MNTEPNNESMLDQLNITEGAYFYKLRKRTNVTTGLEEKVRISNHRVTTLFREVSAKRVGNYIHSPEIREIEPQLDGKVRYSFGVWKLERIPAFLDKDEADICDEIHAYLLIVEIDDYLVISKKYVSGLGHFLNEFVQPVPYDVLSKALITENVRFQALRMRGMDLSGNSIRKRSVEATDLQRSFATISASRNIPDSMRIEAEGNRISVGMTTSRISQLGSKVAWIPFVKWATGMTKAMTDCDPNTRSFLDSFAQYLPFDEAADRQTPAAVLMAATGLIDDFENDRLKRIEYNEQSVELAELFSVLENVFEVQPPDEARPGVYQLFLQEAGEEEDGDDFPLSDLFANLELHRLKHHFKLRSRELGQVYIYHEDADEPQRLLDVLNHDMMVTFQDIEAIYFSKQIFRSTGLLGDIERFIGIFEPIPELAGTSCEKYHDKSDERGAVAYADDSIFRVVEQFFGPKSDYLVCDDHGDEWADHIAIEEGKVIRFLHSKSGKSGYSASQFQVVVAQAQKNIGNLFALDRLEEKKELWDDTVRTSNIQAIRQAPERAGATELIEAYRKTLPQVSVRREVGLVVNFISKETIKAEIDHLKKGEPVKFQTHHLLWLISGFALNCLEASVQPRIYCLPDNSDS